MSDLGSETPDTDTCGLCKAIHDTVDDTSYSSTLQQCAFTLDPRPDNCRQIIWRIPNKAQAFPNEFKFCTVSSPTKIQLNLPDIPYIQHCCSSDTLTNLLRGWKIENNSDSILLKGNDGETWYQEEYKPFEKDFCPQGLVYCGIGFSEHIAKELRSAGSIAKKLACQSRYGAVKIKIKSSIVSKLIGNGAKLYKIGTKRYIKEYSQMILVDALPHLKCAKQINWRVLHLNREEFGSHTALDKIDKINWELNYCPNFCEREGGGCWTHPELVFSKGLQIPLHLATLEFDNSHKCKWGDLAKHCTDCKTHYPYELNGRKRCFGKGLEAEGISYSDIYDVLCNVDIFNKSVHDIGEFALVKFALSLNENGRKEIEDMVTKYPDLFQEADWKKIKCIWEICNDLWVEF